jgi:lipopolysaccharide export system protein LptA
MNGFYGIKAFVFLIVSFSCNAIIAQQSAAPGGGGNDRRINIIQANKLNFKKLNDTTDLQILAGNVVVKQQNNTFYCDSAVLYQNTNTLEAFGHVHINNADSVHTYADYLRYIGNDKKAFLRNNVRLTDGKGVLTTPELEYDTQNKIGTYTQSGKLVNGTTTLTSKEGYYYGQTRDVYFKKNVLLTNPDYIVKTDTLLYNTYTTIATFTVPTVITSGTKKINTTNGYYNLTSKESYFGKRPVIQDSTSTLIADETASNDSTGFAEARGNVIFRDTAQGLAVFANNVKSNRKASSILATQHPVMMVKQNNDSLFVAADTLFSGKLSLLKGIRNVPAVRDSMPPLDSMTFTKQDSARDRYFEAYYHVRIFSDSLQATCDSLFYSGMDSVFRLITNPIVWSQNSQITGDTIYFFTKNKKPERLYVFENALVLNNVDSSNFFNQIRGRTLNSYFDSGHINFIHTQGNAESVYYTQDDDKKFIGVDKSSCDIIDTYFKDQKPYKVIRRSDLKGTFYPMRQVNHEELKLHGFNWQIDKRPKSKYELFGTLDTASRL